MKKDGGVRGQVVSCRGECPRSSSGRTHSQGPRWPGLRLSVLGLSVLGLSVLGLSVLGLSVLGLSVLRLSVLGLSVLGLSVLGLSVLGLSVLGLSVLGLSVLRLSVLVVPACLLASCQSSRKSPAPQEVTFLGNVRVAESPGRPPLPRLTEGSDLRLLFEPLADPARSAGSGPIPCDPFAGGSLHVRLLDHHGVSRLDRDLKLEPPLLQIFERSHRLAFIPATPPEAGETPPPFLLPTGLQNQVEWTLLLTWTCVEPRSLPLTQTLTFLIHPGRLGLPSQLATREALSAVSGLPDEQQEEALGRVLHSAPDEESRLWVERSIARHHYLRGAYLRSEQHALAAARSALRAGLPSEAVLSWSAAHEAARDDGRLTRAQTYLQQGEALAQQLNYRSRLPMEYYTQAVILARLGQPLQAFEALARAQRLARLVDWTLVEQAAILQELELLQALGHHPLVNGRLEQVGMPGGPQAERSPALVNSFGWLILQGVEAGAPLEGDDRRALAKAEQLFEESLEGSRKLGVTVWEANCLANLAATRLLQQRESEVLPLLDQARRLAAPDDPVLIDFLDEVAARLAQAGGRLTQALETFASLEARAESRGDAALAGRAAFQRGEVLFHQGHLPAAIEAYDRALAWIQEDEAVRSPLHQASVLANRSLWEARAVSVRLTLGRSLEALEVLERGTWARRQSLTRGARRARLGPEEAEKVRALREELEEIDRALLSLRRLPPGPERTERQRRKEEERQRRWAQLEMRLGGPTERVPGALDLAALASRLEPGSHLLRLAMLPDELVIWHIGPGEHSLSVRREPIRRAALEMLVERFTESCRTGEPDPVSGARLARLLLGSLRDNPPPRLRVLVEGSLRMLPLAALPVEGGPLVTRSVLSVLPSLFSPTPRAAPTDAAVLVIADPTRDLPEALKEGRAVAARFPGARLLEREAADRKTLLGALPRASLIHYAGHGVTDLERPYLSHLRLARDDRLSLMDIQGLRLAGPVVVLNACEAGTVARVGGGALGLADGFLAAGASAVVASRWDVPDEVGGTISQHLYDGLAGAGEHGAPAALAELQRAFVSGSAGVLPRQATVWSALLALEYL